jgi:hypothetical protein
MWNTRLTEAAVLNRHWILFRVPRKLDEWMMEGGDTNESTAAGSWLGAPHIRSSSSFEANTGSSGCRGLIQADGEVTGFLGVTS